jgi:hypothetical protein
VLVEEHRGHALRELGGARGGVGHARARGREQHAATVRMVECGLRAHCAGAAWRRQVLVLGERGGVKFFGR